MNKIPDNELVLAYELRQEGVEWKWIAKALGLSPIQLKSRVEMVMKHGLYDHRVAILPPMVHAAEVMLFNGLGYESIADHLSVNADQLRNAVWNARRRGKSQRKQQ